jgi:hypothetical protein
MVLLVWAAAGQTQIDLSTQAKNLPIKSGASLPSTCTVGQVYFLNNAPTGANLYGCTAVNTWSAQGGQGGGGTTMQGTLANMPSTCTLGQIYFATDAPAGTNLYGCSAANTWMSEGGTETVSSSGVTIGARPITNFQTGPGLLSVITDTGTAINIQSALDTAVVETLPGEQTGSSLLCASASGSATTYNCSMTPTAASYTVGMVLHWIPDVSGAGGVTTLNVDTLGATAVKQADGVTDPSATDLAAGRMREVWYDGVNFRFLETGAGSGGGSGAVASVYGRTGSVVAVNGDYTAVQVTHAIDSTQTYSNPAWITGLAWSKITGAPVTGVSGVFGRTGVVTAASGDYTAAQVTNAAATNSSNTFTVGTQDSSAAAHTRPMIVVATPGSLPATCAVGEVAFVSSASAGRQVYECSATNVWTEESGGGAPAPVFDTYANRPACNAATTGALFHASDVSNKHWECDGTTWQPVAFDMRVVEPTALAWATVVGAGPDTPIITNAGGAVQLSGTSSSGGYNFLGMLTPLSMTTPYTIEVAFTLDALTSSYSICQWGVASGNSPSSVFLGPGWQVNNGNVFKMITSGTFSSIGSGNRGHGSSYLTAQPVIRSKMVDDGTNRQWYFNTGSGYQLWFSESDTLDVSPASYWGVGCTTAGSGEQFQLTLYHASVHH